MNIQSLCILRLSAIGDVCHAVALVERIQRTRPDIKITWIIGKIEHQLVGDMPGVEFIVFDKKLGKQAYQGLKQALGARQFDAMFVMQVALRANLAARLVKAKYKVGFDWARSKELHWWFANRRIAAQQHAHVLDGFMAFADAIGIPQVPSVEWHIPVSMKDREWAKAQTENLGDFAVISPAASKAERNWVPQRYAQTADYLAEKGKKVVLCGGPGPLDRGLGDQIKQASAHISQDFIGQTSLKQMFALLERATLVVAPDTGPAHMATAAGTPVIGLYAHSNPRRTGPYQNLQNVVSVYDDIVLQQKGKPWTELPWGTRVKGADLMEQIPVEAVFQQIDSLL